jgi:hypothetical protein
MPLLDEIFCRHQLGPFGLWSFSSKISFLTFCLDDPSMGDRRILKSSTTTLLESYVL